MQGVAAVGRAETRRLRSSSRMGVVNVVKIGLAGELGRRKASLLAFSAGRTGNPPYLPRVFQPAEPPVSLWNAPFRVADTEVGNIKESIPI